MSLKTRLLQLERRCPAIRSPESQMMDEELLASLRWFFQVGYLKLEGREVLSTIGHPDLPYYEECAQLAKWLTNRGSNWPDKLLIFLTQQEAQDLLALLDADQLELHPIRELDGSVQRHYLWPDKKCEHQEADQLVRHLDTTLDAWVVQTGQERPVTLEAIRDWVRALVSRYEETAAR